MNNADFKAHRRHFLKLGAAVPLAGILAACGGGDGNSVSPEKTRDVWEGAYKDILSRIREPVFPSQDFDITAYGAVAGRDASQAIAAAIAACVKAGGGRVIVPDGEFITGAIHLDDNVNLHLFDNATLKFSIDPTAYLPAVFTRFEGEECMNYSALIYAYRKKNVAVTGKGKLDGQAGNDNWWEWAWGNPPHTKGQPHSLEGGRSKQQLGQWAATDTPVEQRVLGADHYLRPNFIQFYECENVLIQDVSITNSPMWEIHPVLSRNVIVRGCQIHSHGPNNDGCDPECCTDVLIENCVFDTGDDCIAIKSGKNRDGKRVARPSENIIIRNCTMMDGHGAVTLGSECSGNIRNVFVEGCKMDSKNLNIAFRFKNNAARGGILENVFVRNCEIGEVHESIIGIDFWYGEGDKGPYLPIVRNVRIDRIRAAKAVQLINAAAFPGSGIDDIYITNSSFAGVTKADRRENTGRIVLENVIVT